MVALINCVPVSEPELEGGPVCSICTVVLSAAQNLLEQNKTEVRGAERGVEHTWPRKVYGFSFC